MRSRTLWFWLASAVSLALAVVLVLAVHVARLVATGDIEAAASVLAFLAFLLLMWWAVVLSIALLRGSVEHGATSPQDLREIVGSIRAGLASSATGLAALAVVSDVGDLGRLGATQYSMLGAAAIVSLAAALAGWMVRRGLAARLVERLGRLVADDPAQPPRRAAPLQWIVSHPGLMLGLALLATGAAYLWLVPIGALGHDESVYAVKARSWIAGTPDSGFEVYRPVGMPVVAWVVLELGGGDVALRVLAAAVALGAVVLVWRLGTRLLSPTAGVIGAALIATSPTFLRRAPEFLNDIASSAMVVAIILLLWRHFESRGTARWEVVLSAPLAAAAFYLRYGSVTTLTVVALVGGAVWRDRLVASRRELAIAASLLVALVLPHVLYALAETGSVTGILTRSTQAAGREYLGEGLVTYARWFPNRLAGPLLGVVMALGLVKAALAVIRGGLRRGADASARAAMLLVGIGLGHLLLTGVFVHAEQRYVFLSIMLIGLVGSRALVEGLARLANPLRDVLVVGAIAVFAAASAIGLAAARASFDDLGESRRVLEDSSAAIREAVGEGECTVMTSYVPQITWYTGCTTVLFNLDRPPRSLRSPQGEVDLVLLFENGKRQPEGAVLDRYVAVLGDPIVVIDEDQGTIGDATIYRIGAAR